MRIEGGGRRGGRRARVREGGQRDCVHVGARVREIPHLHTHHVHTHPHFPKPATFSVETRGGCGSLSIASLLADTPTPCPQFTLPQTHPNLQPAQARHGVRKALEPVVAGRQLGEGGTVAQGEGQACDVRGKGGAVCCWQTAR